MIVQVDQLTKEECNYLTFQTDGTTKYSQHFSTYNIGTDDTVYHLSLRHTFLDSLDDSTETLDDLNIVSKELRNNGIS